MTGREPRADAHRDECDQDGGDRRITFSVIGIDHEIHTAAGDQYLANAFAVLVAERHLPDQGAFAAKTLSDVTEIVSIGLQMNTPPTRDVDQQFHAGL